MKINKKILLKDLGLKDYKDIWEYQTSLLNSIIDIKRQTEKTAPKILQKIIFFLLSTLMYIL